MPLLIPALGGALVVAGIIGLILGARRTPATDPAPRRPVQSRLGARVSHMDRRTKVLILAGVVLGVIIYLVTGWLIAERLGINVIGRHTALGDAFVTGEVFLKMIPLLADMGIVTLRQALEAAQKTYFARIQY